MPPSHIVLHRRDRPSRGEHENPVVGSIVRCGELGESTAVALRVISGERADIHFAVPTHVARRNGVVWDGPASVSLLADGIHLMRATDPTATAAWTGAAVVAGVVASRRERHRTRQRLAP